MSVSERIFIKVDDNNIYNARGSFKSLKDIHTHNDITFPQTSLVRDNYVHPVLNSFGTDCNAYKQIYNQSTETDKFVNAEEKINFNCDSLSDAITPILSNRLYKSNINYNVMHPYMVAILDSFARDKITTTDRITLEPTNNVDTTKTYTLNAYGSLDKQLKNCGIIELQGAGGGSGGTNNKDEDCAGAGGGGGAYIAFYYRIKNTSAQITLSLTVGAGGEKGVAGGGGYAGTGGATKAVFVTPNNTLTLVANGGGGGGGGNYNYTRGGTGGSAITLQHTIEGGIGGGSDVSTVGNGALLTDVEIYDDEYIRIVVLTAQSGAGGGRGDDTGGSAAGQAGGNTSAISFEIPSVIHNQGYPVVISYSSKSGGRRGASVSDSTSGGGGASTLSAGSAGGDASSTGNNGILGSGAGGAGCGGNANREGSTGGNGVIYIY